MNSRSYMLAIQLCVVLGVSTCFGQATVLREIDTLKEYFNASSSDITDGGPLFSNILKNWKEDSDKKIFQSQIISFYFRLFDTLKDYSLQSSMEAIKENLLEKFFNRSEEKMNDFKKLIQIPVNNLQVQRKAVSELIKVMNDLFPKPIQRKRKRSRCCFGMAEHPSKSHPARAI